MMACCSKVICTGCDIANMKHQLAERVERGLPKVEGYKKLCPFCRQPTPNSEKESIKIVKKRIEKNDPVALRQVGTRRYEEGDFDIAIEH